MYECFVCECICVSHCACYPRPEESTGSPGTGENTTWSQMFRNKTVRVFEMAPLVKALTAEPNDHTVKEEN